jgi:YVTN family beta-propeller protein
MIKRVILSAIIIFSFGSSNIKFAQTSSEQISIVASIPVGANPYGIAINPVSNRIYVTNSLDDTVSVIHGNTNLVIATVPVGTIPRGIAVNSSTNKIYVANAGGSLTVIDGNTNSVIEQVPITINAEGVAVNEVTNRIYVTVHYNNAVGNPYIEVLDGSTDTIIATVPNTYPCNSPTAVGVNPNTNLVYVGGDCLAMFPGNSNFINDYINITRLNAITVNPLTNRIYAVNDLLDGTIHIVNGASFEILESKQIPNVLPEGVAVNTSTNHIFISARMTGLNGVAVLNGATNTFIGEPIRFGEALQGIAVNSNTNLVYVCDTGENRIVVLEDTASYSPVTISHIEITQVIQDEQNSVPLIAKKPTFVRVYVDCGVGCSSISDVTGKLEVSSAAGSASLSPNMGAITAYHPNSWADQRGDLRKTLNFYTIPSNLLTGDVTFTAYVGSATLSETRLFMSGNRLRIAWVPILYQPNSPDPPTYRPDPAITYQAWFYMSKIYPIATYDLDYFYQPVQPSNQLMSSSKFTPDRAWNEYLKLLQGFWNVTTHSDGWRGGQPDRLFGWIPDQAYVRTDGMAFANWPDTITPWLGSGQVAAGIANQVAERTFAHEIGHILRLNELLHAPCRVAGDPLFPNAEGLIDDWGINFTGQAPELQSPESVVDFMSYCSPSWISKYHYQKLVPGFQDFAQADIKIAAESQPVLVVSGEVLTPSLDVNFGSFYPLISDKLTDENRGTEYCLELRDTNELIIDSRCFNLSFTEPESGLPLDSETFATTIPYPQGTNTVVLTHLGTELGRVTKSDQAPSVRLVYPNGGESWDSTGKYNITWVADDADGDLLSFIVSYSVDDGATWMPIALDIKTNSLEVESQYLPGSKNARFKVIATDQMNGTSDSSDASLTVNNKEPQVFIISPEQDMTIPSGIPIYLQGYAYDLEDGKLVDSSLEWFSNLDGDLGIGDTVITSLTDGRHEVTLSATDSDGNIVSYKIYLNVGFKLYLPLISK